MPLVKRVASGCSCWRHRRLHAVPVLLGDRLLAEDRAARCSRWTPGPSSPPGATTRRCSSSPSGRTSSTRWWCRSPRCCCRWCWPHGVVRAGAHRVPRAARRCCSGPRRVDVPPDRRALGHVRAGALAGLLQPAAALIVSYLILTLPFTIWVLTTFMRELPKELEEAAIMDGPRPGSIVSRVFLPLLGPAHGHHGPAGLHRGVERVPLRAHLHPRTSCARCRWPSPCSAATASSSCPGGSIMAASVIVTVPLVVLVLVFQRRIVAGPHRRRGEGVGPGLSGGGRPWPGARAACRRARRGTARRRRPGRLRR